MDTLISAQQLMLLVAVVVVALAAASRFNSPLPVSREVDGLGGWMRELFSVNPGGDDRLAPPARAATTAFKYRTHQAVYAALAVFLLLFIHAVPEVHEQLGRIIGAFAGDAEIPLLGQSGVLVVAAFVILVLPNVPPFRWADQAIRRSLYLRAAIPAQQWRECSRLKHATYNPPASTLERVRVLAAAEGFEPDDLSYDPDSPTTRSLWTKCMTLMYQLSQWQADEHYKTAFAVLREADGRQHSIAALQDAYMALQADARICLGMLRGVASEDPEAEQERERRFREDTKALLMRIYLMLARISLHAHYSDRERVRRFLALGFHLEARPITPLPDLNDLVGLGMVLAVVLVLPLANGRLGMTGAVMVALIMYSAVLTPVILARVCPGLRRRREGRHTPLLAFPVLSGALAALIGAVILSIGGSIIGPTAGCDFSGVERYLNCSYPWSYLHAGMAMLLAWRMTAGSYPLQGPGLSRYQKLQRWINPVDAVLCMTGMMAIYLFATQPALEQLFGPSAGDPLVRALRVGLLGLVMGALVPTWFRGYGQRRVVERRRDPEARARWAAQVRSQQGGVQIAP